jgi:hypothetical protein
LLILRYAIINLPISLISNVPKIRRVCKLVEIGFEPATNELSNLRLPLHKKPCLQAGLVVVLGLRQNILGGGGGN